MKQKDLINGIVIYLKESWSEDGMERARDDRDKAVKFNKAAVGTTIATGALLVLTIAGSVLKRKKREEISRAAISPTAIGVKVQF